MSDIEEGVQDFLDFGDPCVWVISPQSGKACIAGAGGLRESHLLKAGTLSIPLSAIRPPA
jgi:hypothetical protein